MKKVFKTFLFILIILLFFILFHILRNMIIIKSLEKKVSVYHTSQNYSIKCNQFNGNNLVVAKTLRKDDIILFELNSINKSFNREIINFTKNNNTTSYISAKDSKIAILNSSNMPSPLQITSCLETPDFYSFLIMSTFSTIGTDNCNGKKCYKINLAYSPAVLYDENGSYTVYIDKETGLTVREQNGTAVGDKNDRTDCIEDFYYEFNTVTDEQLIEPDINEYVIQQ